MFPQTRIEQMNQSFEPQTENLRVETTTTTYHWPTTIANLSTLLHTIPPQLLYAGHILRNSDPTCMCAANIPSENEI